MVLSNLLALIKSSACEMYWMVVWCTY